MDRGARQATVHGIAESGMTEQLTHTNIFLLTEFLSQHRLNTYYVPDSVLGTQQTVVNCPCL